MAIAGPCKRRVCQIPSQWNTWSFPRGDASPACQSLSSRSAFPAAPTAGLQAWLLRGASDHMESHIPGDAGACQRACLHGSQLDCERAVGKRQKSRAYPSLCCSLPFPRSAGIALPFNRSRACPRRTLPKTILKIRFIKFDLLRNRMSY